MEGFLKALIQKIYNIVKKLTFDANSNLLVGINTDNVGLAKESTLQTVSNNITNIANDTSIIRDKIEDEIDNLGWIRVYAWDSTNSQWVLIEGKFNGREYTYDANGNLSQITLKMVKPDGSDVTVKKTFDYDANGNLTSESAWTL